MELITAVYHFSYEKSGLGLFKRSSHMELFVGSKKVFTAEEVIQQSKASEGNRLAKICRVLSCEDSSPAEQSVSAPRRV